MNLVYNMVRIVAEVDRIRCDRFENCDQFYDVFEMKTAIPAS